MKKILLITLLFLIKFMASSQNISWDNVKIFGGTGLKTVGAMKVVKDGYYLHITSDTTVDFSNKKMTAEKGRSYLCKTDFSLNLLWSKELDYFREMEVDASGNVYLIGTISLFIMVEDSMVMSTGNTDGFIIKYTSEGNLGWIKQYSGYASEGFNHITIDNSDNIYVTGSTSDMASTPSIFNDQGVFLLKYNTSGNLLLQKEFKSPFTEINVLPKDGKLYLFGAFRDITIGSTRYQSTSEEREMFLGCLTNLGDVIWVKTFKTPGELNFRIKSAGTDGIYAAGMFSERLSFSKESSINKTNLKELGFFLVKFDDLGNPLWQNYFVTELQYFLDIGIGVDAKENVYTVGAFSEEMNISDTWKVNPTGFGQSNFIIVFDKTGTKMTNASFASTFSAITALDTYQEKVFIGGSFSFEAQLGNNTFNESNSLLIGSPAIATTTALAPSLSPEKSVKVFPNPSSSDFIIEGTFLTEVEIYSLQGKKIENFNKSEFGNKTKISGLNPGLYVVKYSSQGIPGAERIHIQNTEK